MDKNLLKVESPNELLVVLPETIGTGRQPLQQRSNPGGQTSTAKFVELSTK
jgi:hypothetical protein